MANVRGGCLCGNLRYVAASEPVQTVICHCKNCQRQTGTAFSVLIVVPKAALSFEGTLATYGLVGDSGLATHRHFCPKCGSSIAIDGDLTPEFAYLNAGTLEDTSRVKPAAAMGSLLR
jgi:hypothetical protein